MATNTPSSKSSPGWYEAIRGFLHPRVITMLFLGFSAGLPLWLMFSSLSLWLREAGVERGLVTLFSWAALGYSFKFVWAPLTDSLKIPFLFDRLGRRRSWMLCAQMMIILAICLMAIQDPSEGQTALICLAMATVLLGFSSATQDIVIDAFRIEAADSDLQAMMSATYIAGYRIGMLLSGAGALFLAQYFGSTKENYSFEAWQLTYFIMAVGMLVGVCTTLIISEPSNKSQTEDHPYKQNLKIIVLFAFSVAAFIAAYLLSSELFVSIKSLITDISRNNYLGSLIAEFGRLSLAVFCAYMSALLLIRAGYIDRNLVVKLYIDPIKEFFIRYGFSTSIIILSLIGLYRISDIVLGVISNVFYQDLGYSKTEIASVSKVFGVLMSIVGGFIGGLLSFRFGVLKILFLGAILSAATNLLFMLLADIGYNIAWLWLVIGADNLCAGIASAAFVAFLSALTNIRFTAMQFAIFTSLMTLLPKVIGGYSGGMVDAMGYSQFFLITAVLGIPVLFLILLISRDSRFDLKGKSAFIKS